MLATIADEELYAAAWLAAHAEGVDELLDHLRAIDIAASCRKAGVSEEQVRHAARTLAAATGGVSIFEDLGIQMAPHSTLNSYLEKLLVLLTGNFGVPGGMNLHTRFASLGGGSGGGTERVTPVTGHRLVTGLVPCNVMPDEMLGDHPDRFRAMLIESGNPVHSVADSQRMRQALQALELVVVIDVALTETAREAHYVLPAASQYEKWECTFFNLEFPRNFFHLRRPLLSPAPGTLPEAEIHARLCRALGAYTDAEVAPLRTAAARSRADFAGAFFELVGSAPQLGRLASVLMYEGLGPSLQTDDRVDAAGAAAIWGLAHKCAGAYPESLRRAGFDGDGFDLGEQLFHAVLNNASGVVFSVDDYDETWRRVQHTDGRVHLVIEPLLAEFDGLATEPGATGADPEFPFVLSAGERRSSTANTILRDPSWRKKDQQGSLRLSPDDAVTLGVGDGDRIRITTRRGTAVAIAEVYDRMMPGHVSLPNGFGLGPGGSSDAVGVSPNELTSSEERDWFAGTPHHKHVPARLERVEV
jgi:anaerobic selenocysteine-containing dehydrogenase